jgi:hypothetical protein
MMPRSSEYAFRRQLASLNPLKRSGGKTRFTAIIATFTEHFRDLDQLITGKKHIRLLGASYMNDLMRGSGILTSICGAKGPFPAVAAMVVMFVFFTTGWKAY